jgi:hypothetical protein
VGKKSIRATLYVISILTHLSLDMRKRFVRTNEYGEIHRMVPIHEKAQGGRGDRTYSHEKGTRGGQKGFIRSPFAPGPNTSRGPEVLVRGTFSFLVPIHEKAERGRGDRTYPHENNQGRSLGVSSGLFARICLISVICLISIIIVPVRSRVLPPWIVSGLSTIRG